MLEIALVAFTTFFATIGPIDTAAFFAALTPRRTRRERLWIAIKASLIATGLLLVFALFGEFALGVLGVSLAALKTAGGILLLLIGIDMVFARPSGAISATSPEREEASHRDDIAVFPLATPLIAGPGAMSAAILLMASVEGDPLLQSVVIAMLLAVMAITLGCLLLAVQVHDLFGVTAMAVVTRVFGILLAALAVQFLFEGLAGSGLLPGAVAPEAIGGPGAD